MIPDNLESGPPPGQWREQIASRSSETLFQELLVPINGQEDGWSALSQAIVIAQRESASLYGLHVQPGDLAEDDPHIVSLQNEFSQRCEAGNVPGKLVVTTGEVVEQTCLRSPATDLVVVNLSYPPADQPLARVSSGFRNLLVRCPRPVLATPQTVSTLSHALLAFDGSPKSMEAMYVAAYLGSKWSIPLEILVADDKNRVDETTLAMVKDYLTAHQVEARYYLEAGAPLEDILKISQQEQCDFVIMGGYGYSPLLEVMLGSTVDQVLRESPLPTLICR